MNGRKDKYKDYKTCIVSQNNNTIFLSALKEYVFPEVILNIRKLIQEIFIGYLV